MAYDNPIAAASQVIQVSKVYSGDTDTPMEELKEIPKGEDEFTVTFNFESENMIEWLNRQENLSMLRKSMAKVAYDIHVKATQAYAFDQYVRAVHNIPQDSDTLKRLRVKGIYQTLTTGYYKTVTLVFEDGSVYRAG